jgi:glutamyl-tRNA synthetase
LPAQLALAETLNLPTPVYGHLPLMLPDPVSGDGTMPTLAQLRRQGYRPEAVLNHLARLGHRHDSDQLLDLDTLAKGFHISRLSREPVFHRQSLLDHWQQKTVAEH